MPEAAETGAAHADPAVPVAGPEAGARVMGRCAAPAADHERKS
ncbi:MULTISPECIES: hypothetical protein [unclassified Streptomyces]|nr:MULTISPECIES: hypothetical protein [unclassified Streptomyces]